ncbi:MAG: hypothetical protein HQK84_01475 [Nitrospinae bacterium]|nr:hypothetical protein [Nitrospinota bacterium]
MAAYNEIYSLRDISNSSTIRVTKTDNREYCDKVKTEYDKKVMNELLDSILRSGHCFSA